MKLAIVILNWNGKDMLRKYLPTVIQNSRIEGVEVIVADNGSDDGSVDMMEKEFSTIPMIVLDKNYGFAEGYNQALHDLDAEFFLLLNSDVEIKDKDWLHPLLSFMEANPDVAACQPKLRSLLQTDMFEYAGAAGGFIDCYGYPFCRGRLMSCVERDNGQYDAVQDVFWATGAALMVRAKDFWTVGGLDGRFFAHMEEIDLCWRLRSTGQRVVCVPQSVVYHLGGGSLGQGHPRKTFLNFRNNLMMLYKNLPDSDLKKVMRVRSVLDVVAAFSFLAKGEYANFKAVFKARTAFKQMRNELEEDRQKIRERRSLTDIPEQAGFSLLWQFYVKRNKKFSQLSGFGR
mgnify:CR=1 FL=1